MTSNSRQKSSQCRPQTRQNPETRDLHELLVPRVKSSMEECVGMTLRKPTTPAVCTKSGEIRFQALTVARGQGGGAGHRAEIAATLIEAVKMQHRRSLNHGPPQRGVARTKELGRPLWLTLKIGRPTGTSASNGGGPTGTSASNGGGPTGLLPAMVGVHMGGFRTVRACYMF